MHSDKQEFEIIKPLYWAGGRDDGNTGTQRLFKTGENHYVISQVQLDCGFRENQYETMVFNATEAGQVTSWSEAWVHHDDSKLDIDGLIKQAVEEGLYHDRKDNENSDD